MRTSAVIHQTALRDVPELEVHAWRADLLRQLDAGRRLVTLFGRRHGERVVITAVVEARRHALEISRTSVDKDRGFHALTAEVPAAHCFERELHEQTGVRIAGHPWLKPLRYQGQSRSAMSAYPFYAIQGKEVHEVAVGPIHAGVIEPGAFRFMCTGEQVLHLEIQLGYQHRGVEARLLEGDPRRHTPLVETIAGDTSVAHAWAQCAALERLSACEIAPEADAARAVALELERVAMHLASLSGLCADLGFLQGATTYGRLRATAINATMRLCGSRFGRGAVVPGGARVTLSPAVWRSLTDDLERIRDDVTIINDCFLSAQTVKHRLQGVGVLSERTALELGVVGAAARSSGLALDLRQKMDGGVYSEVPIALTSNSAGDCWARASVRLGEIDASLRWLAAMLARHAAWAKSRAAVGPLAPAQLAVCMVEGWRGEVVHCLETGAAGELVHHKVQDPSLRNWMGLAIAMRGNEISDFPICNKSFDLSYCGHDL